MIVTIPSAEAGRKSTYRSLIDRHGNITKSGTYFYEKLNQEPPNRGFDPNQQAERAPPREIGDHHVEGWLPSSCADL